VSKASGEQTIVCEGCGSKWLVIASSKARVLSRLVECPLCGLEAEA